MRPRVQPKLSPAALRSRRTFLKSVGATAATLPFLRALPSYAQDAQPKLITVFSGNGRVRHLWGANAAPGPFTLKQNLAPLQPYAQHILLPNGLRNVGAKEIGGTHEGGVLSCFTGAGKGFTQSAANSTPSIDTYFMAKYGAESARPDSFYQQVCATRMAANAAGPLNRIAFDMAGKPRDPFPSAWEAVDGYFADFVSGAPGAPGMAEMTATKDLAREKLFKALDQQLGSLESRMCSDDYYQIQAMRELVSQTSAGVRKMVQCQIPTLPAKPPTIDIYNPPKLADPPQEGGKDKPVDLTATDDWFRQRCRLASDLLVLALGCGLTRAGVIGYDQGAGDATGKGHTAHLHDLSHATPQLYSFVKNQSLPVEPFFLETDTQNNPSEEMLKQFGPVWAQLSDWELFYAHEVAYLLGQLEQFGLIDDTLLLWGSDINAGSAHTHYNMPYVVAAGSQVPVQRGQVIAYPETNVLNFEKTDRAANGERTVNDLLRTVLQVQGVTMDSVGDTSANRGVLTELLA